MLKKIFGLFRKVFGMHLVVILNEGGNKAIEPDRIINAATASGAEKIILIGNDQLENFPEQKNWETLKVNKYSFEPWFLKEGKLETRAGLLFTIKPIEFDTTMKVRQILDLMKKKKRGLMFLFYLKHYEMTSSENE